MPAERLEQQFVLLCQQEADHVSLLVQVLQQEQQAMINGSTELLEPLADSKSRLLDELAGQSQQRGLLMKELGLSDSDTVYIWLADKPAARDAWVALEDGVHRAQSINELNGRYIADRLSHVEDALCVLRQAASATLSYGKDGVQPAGISGQRFLGSA
ncbi:flagellar protein FlgN [uncultured Aquitalea sp.]|uniref:flagella synthesis protein FlgN n=1 Tax=uncultured Aquitalea sp. TaxID=540272 RepID=UPI0025E06702|nr:flagellar protein FlgN [uncultured Aquitalea sp.]